MRENLSLRPGTPDREMPEIEKALRLELCKVQTELRRVRRAAKLGGPVSYACSAGDPCPICEMMHSAGDAHFLPPEAQEDP